MKQTFALVDERISDKCFSALTDRGFYPVRLPKMPSLPSPIASHTDIISFKLKEKLFFSRKYFELFREQLSPLGSQNLLLTDMSQGEKYPLDAIFNGLLISDILFCKSDTFSKEILAEAEREGIRIVHVNQGYPACTTLKISENAAVTADRGMEKALLKEGISVLFIENGDISLPPYDYGFIGGCAGIYKDEIFFLGDIKRHRDCDRICDFITSLKKKSTSLSDEPLSDLGGIIFTEATVF